MRRSCETTAILARTPVLRQRAMTAFASLPADRLGFLASQLIAIVKSKDEDPSVLAAIAAAITRHGDPAATRELLKSLPSSPFARRSKRTREQLTELERHVRVAIAPISSGSEAAIVLGWAKRLCAVYKQRSS